MKRLNEFFKGRIGRFNYLLSILIVVLGLISSKIYPICILLNRTCRFGCKSCLYWSGVFYRGFILSTLADKLRLIRSPYFSPPSLLYFFRKCFEVKVH